MIEIKNRENISLGRGDITDQHYTNCTFVDCLHTVFKRCTFKNCKFTGGYFVAFKRCDFDHHCTIT